MAHKDDQQGPSCRGKTAYTTLEAAEKAAERQSTLRKFPLHPYACHECGCYHLRGFKWGMRKG